MAIKSTIATLIIPSSMISILCQEYMPVVSLPKNKYELPFFEDKTCDIMKPGGWLIGARC